MSGLSNFTSGEIVAGLLISMIVAAELGYRRGRVRAQRTNTGITTSRAIIKTAMLGMVGLLLAFSYSMAASRYDLRYAIILREANTIGTCWLRAGFLPEESRAQTRKLLRELVDTRVEHLGMMTDPAGFQRTADEMDRIQNEVWDVVEQAFRNTSEPARLVPLVQAVNEMIDTSTDRKAAAWNHIPPSVLTVLVICITISSFLVGHCSGEAEWRDYLMWTLFLALIAMVFYTMLDMDRPAQGLIRLNPTPLLDLQRSMLGTRS